MKTFLSIAAAAALAATAAQAQNEPKEPFHVEHDVIKFAAPGKEDVMFERHALSVAGAAPVQFISSEGSVMGKPVKGAPYSAEGVNESTQTLADGNRIVSKNSTFTYRDSEGRTRNEMTLAMPGMADPPRFITINDPVAGTSYHLDTNLKIARKMLAMPGGGMAMGIAMGTMSTPAVQVMRTAPVGAQPAASGAAVGGMFSVEPSAGARTVLRTQARTGGEPKVEDLGKRAIEGVEAEGARTTIAIPAGEIGNEREILIVTERWYSPELQTVVLSKHSDPRMGETTYSLTNIKISEPDPSLFQPSAEYTVQSDEGPGVRVIRKMIEHK